MLTGLAAKALPSILGELAAGLVPGAVKRAVGDGGLYLHKLGHCVKVDPVRKKRNTRSTRWRVVFETWFNDSRRIRIDIGTEQSFKSIIVIFIIVRIYIIYIKLCLFMFL